jgi:hypothetical protein
LSFIPILNIKGFPAIKEVQVSITTYRGFPKPCAYTVAELDSIVEVLTLSKYITGSPASNTSRPIV